MSGFESFRYSNVPYSSSHCTLKPLLFFQRMWALCDLAMGLLISKSTTYELKEFPAEPSISPMFFIPHEDPNFFNVESYLPQELVVQPPKKLGITIQYLQPTSATAKKKRVRMFYPNLLTV